MSPSSGRGRCPTLALQAMPKGSTADVVGFDSVQTATYRVKAGRTPAKLRLRNAFPVAKDGRYHALVVADGLGHGACAVKVVDGHGYLEFKGARGFLPGRMWSYLPFYGALTAVYAVAAGWFALLMARNRASLLDLQWAILGVMALGLAESAAWLLTNARMNASGAPACCPLRGDIVVSFVLQTLKQTVSRVLLLAVCLGFGVVRPRLSTQQTLVVGVLGAAYCATSFLDELVYINALSDASVGGADPTRLWSFVAAAVDAVVIVAIWVALRDVTAELEAAHQTAKLAMYARLGRALFGAIAVFVVYVRRAL
jgi:hypothetical protein